MPTTSPSPRAPLHTARPTRARALFLVCGLCAPLPAPALAQQAPSPVLLQAESRLTPGGGPTDDAGTDLIVGDITEVRYWGTAAGFLGYSIGTVSCNIGSTTVTWNANTSAHPIVAQNMYRLRDGRFEQIGMSWVKHATSAGAESFCNTCQPSGTNTLLGIGCSDPYTSNHNGGQVRLGPRSDINPTTGVFPYPYTLANGNTGDASYKRIQVAPEDIQDSSALYFAESTYIHPDDAQDGNGLNNASYRRIVFNAATLGATVQETTAATMPAIYAWREHGRGVGSADPDVRITVLDYPEQGLTARFLVASKVSSNGNGTWHYEYAIENLNSNRAAGSFVVPRAPGSSVTNLAWHGVPYHSGEIYDNAPWVASASSGTVTFSTAQTFTSNPNGSALRWGTLHNFRFDSSAAPQTGTATIGLFRPPGSGEPASLSVSLQVPGTGGGPPPCYANCDGSATPPILNVADFSCFVQKFAAGDPYSNCDSSSTPPTLNIFDFVCFMQRFAAGCP